MEEIEEKPSLGRKIYIAAALFLILVVLPAGSWIYLRNGLNWRKTAVAELSNYGKIRGAYVIWPDQTKEDLLKNKVVVVHTFGESPDLTADNRKIIDTGQKLFSQFGQNTYFRLAMISNKGTSEFLSYAQTLPSSEYATWVWTGGLGSWSTILENSYESYCLAEKVSPAKEYYALADTSGTIRRFYDALDDKQVERMVQHIAILLPPSE
ncbi:MAG: hypothetical protein IPK76_21800 [Lewinellaceae bacterium]|jgi:hypothetical protein|nr:hypothetical protein [Lewinellaceae bacterium]